MFEECKRGWWDGDVLRTWEKFVIGGGLASILPKDPKKTQSITR